MRISPQTVRLIGLGLMVAASFFRMYMFYRLRETNRFALYMTVGLRKYRELVAQGKAPFWPVPLLYFFGLSGLAVWLSAFLLE